MNLKIKFCNHKQINGFLENFPEFDPDEPIGGKKEYVSISPEFPVSGDTILTINGVCGNLLVKIIQYIASDCEEFTEMMVI